MPYIVSLKNLRLGIGLSQAKLAGRAGVDRETISRSENGYAIQELTCGRIRNALIAAGLPEPVVIDPGGIQGPQPRKGQGRPGSAPKSKKR